MKSRAPLRRRGQPLLALILLMTSWIGARAAMWDDPVVKPIAAEHGSPRPLVGQKPSPLAPRVETPAPIPASPAANPPLRPPGQPAPQFDAPLPQTAIPQVPEPQRGAPAAALPGTAPAAVTAPMSPRIAAGHQQLWLSGMAMMPNEEGGAAEQVPSRMRPVTQAAGAAQPRWSGDAWLLLRSGGNGYNAPGSGLPGVFMPLGFYGGSQAGAALRYRLSVTSPFRPSLYLRVSSGMQYPRGEELAAGLSLRPLPRLPVALLLEGRVTRTVSGTVVRPAAALVSEFPPVRLPLGTRGEVYVQAGYVGGRAGTAFVDGQARIEHPLVKAGGFQLRAGGGAWGGAQRGASRVDVGPTATLAVPIGPAGARLSADYRFRVVGNAAPDSGPVVTLSAGF